MSAPRARVLACALALVAILPGIAAAQAPAAAAPKPAAKPAPSTRKVWTAADLEKLRTQAHGVTMLQGASSPSPIPSSESMVAPATPGPQGVPARLQEMVTEAQANLDRLDRERLAASNPLLRGLAAGAPPRPISEIDKDRLKWSDRLKQAESALSNAAGSGGSSPAPSN